MASSIKLPRQSSELGVQERQVVPVVTPGDARRSRHFGRDGQLGNAVAQGCNLRPELASARLWTSIRARRRRSFSATSEAMLAWWR
eukprot:15205805-Alexandrium_andersonii.AAC.1